MTFVENILLLGTMARVTRTLLGGSTRSFWRWSS